MKQLVKLPEYCNFKNNRYRASSHFYIYGNRTGNYFKKIIKINKDIILIYDRTDPLLLVERMMQLCFHWLN